MQVKHDDPLAKWIWFETLDPDEPNRSFYAPVVHKVDLQAMTLERIAVPGETGRVEAERFYVCAPEDDITVGGRKVVCTRPPRPDEPNWDLMPLTTVKISKVFLSPKAPPEIRAAHPDLPIKDFCQKPPPQEVPRVLH